MKFVKKRLQQNLLFTSISVLFCFGCNHNLVKVDKDIVKRGSNVRVVPKKVAYSIARKFNPNIFFRSSNASNGASNRSSLNGENKIKRVFTLKGSLGLPAMYVFNYADNNGILFVSADSSLRPVLAFIGKGEFKKDTVPSGLLRWARVTMRDIEAVREGEIDNSLAAKAAWREYFRLLNPRSYNRMPPADSPYHPTDPCKVGHNIYDVTTVDPLLKTAWGQSCTYNDLCPNLNCSSYCNLHVLTGCIATATSQIIRYWEPVNNYNYDYDIMPDNKGNSEVQRLMHDVGVSVNMDYGCMASGAQNSSISSALKSEFGFTSAKYSTYNSSSYLDVKSNIEKHQPVVLGGFANETNEFLGIWYSYDNGHSWVCDGTRNVNVKMCVDNGIQEVGLLYFHMNWGWHEISSNPPLNQPDYNGWFAYNNWAVQISGKSLQFEYAKDMVYGISL